MTPFSILATIRLRETACAHKESEMNKLWKQFGSEVRAARKRRKIGLNDMAARLGVTAALVAMMESGKRSWGTKRAEKVVHILCRPEQWPDAGRGPI